MLALIYVVGCVSSFLLGLWVQAVRIRRLEERLIEHEVELIMREARADTEETKQ